MNKYKTFEELKEELGDKFEDYMYKANVELLNKLDKIKEYVKKEISLINKDLSECELTYSEKYNFENAKNKYINILELLEEVNE